MDHINPPHPQLLGEFPCDAYNNKNYQSVDKTAWLLPHELAAVLSYLICLKFQCITQGQLTGLYSRNQMIIFPLWLVKQLCASTHTRHSPLVSRISSSRFRICEKSCTMASDRSSRRLSSTSRGFSFAASPSYTKHKQMYTDHDACV